MIGFSGSTIGWESIFPESMVPEILELMIEAWPKRVKTDAKEVPITLGYCQAMRTLKRYRQAPNVLLVVEESELTVDAEIKGRIDFKFVSGFDEDVYFAWEAKRLHIDHGRPNYSEYAGTEGMGCFISGKYSHTQKQGGMLGYVLDAQVKKAWSGVCRNITSKSSELKLIAGPSKTNHRRIRNDYHLGESEHCLTDKDFTMVHFLLPMN